MTNFTDKEQFGQCSSDLLEEGSYRGIAHAPVVIDKETKFQVKVFIVIVIIY